METNNIEETGFASELLSELKKQTHRWFVAFLIMIGVEVATIGVFMWYISLPDESVRVESTSEGHANYIGNDLNGDLNNGESDSNQENETEQKQ